MTTAMLNEMAATVAGAPYCPGSAFGVRTGTCGTCGTWGARGTRGTKALGRWTGAGDGPPKPTRGGSVEWKPIVLTKSEMNNGKGNIGGDEPDMIVTLVAVEVLVFVVVTGRTAITLTMRRKNSALLAGIVGTRAAIPSTAIQQQRATSPKAAQL